MPYAPSLRIGLCLLFLAKITIACAFGPIHFLDTSGYTLFADRILKDSRWLTQQGNAVDYNLVFRTAGYPLVIAAAKIIFGSSWAYAVLVVQALGSCLAFAPMMRILEATVARRWIIWAAMVCYGFSGSTLFDSAILTDSLNASIFVAVVSGALGAGLGLWSLSPLILAGMGFLWGYGLWMRDAGVYLAVIPLGILAASFYRQRRSGPAIACAGVIFIIPLVMMAGVYMGWNHYRTGHMTIGGTGHMNWLQMPMYMEGRGYGHPFTGTDEVDEAVRRAAPQDYDTLDAVAKVLAELRKAHGYNDRELGVVASRKYFTTVRHHPIGFLRNTAHNFQPHATAFLLTNPLWNLNEFYQFGPGQGNRLLQDTRKMLRQLQANFTLSGLGLLIADSIARLISIILFALFLIGVPIWAAITYGKQKHLNDNSYIAFTAWAGFMIFAGIYSAVYVEMRYFTPIIPLALAAMALLVDRLVDFWSMRRLHRLARR